MPDLLRRSMERTNEVIQAKMPEFQQRLEAAIEELKAESGDSSSESEAP